MLLSHFSDKPLSNRRRRFETRMAGPVILRFQLGVFVRRYNLLVVIIRRKWPFGLVKIDQIPRDQSLGTSPDATRLCIP